MRISGVPHKIMLRCRSCTSNEPAGLWDPWDSEKLSPAIRSWKRYFACILWLDTKPEAEHHRISHEFERRSHETRETE